MYANVKKYVLKGLKVWLCHYLALMNYYARKIDKPSLKKNLAKIYVAEHLQPMLVIFT